MVRMVRMGRVRVVRIGLGRMGVGMLPAAAVAAAAAAVTAAAVTAAAVVEFGYSSLLATDLIEFRRLADVRAMLSCSSVWLGVAPPQQYAAVCAARLPHR